MSMMPKKNGHSLDHYVKELQEILCQRFDHEPIWLLGWCHKNAPTLASWLILNGFEGVNVIRGGLDLEGCTTPVTVSEANKHGLIHYWVEVEGEQTTWVCDVASESLDHTPDYICLPEHPPEYIRFEIERCPPEPYNIPEIRV